MDSATDIDRGHVLWATDPFKPGSDAERPLVVLSNDTHPFHDEQWIAAGVSTAPRPHALELTAAAWTQGSLPQRSYVYPWAVLSPRIGQINYVVGRVTSGFVDEIAGAVGTYITSSD
jgi:mRNA-degrading endonuclease toxin of MazEF toxin-antitoxin module